VTTADASEGFELIVAADGSIPADQLARLGLRPGVHLRVVAERSGPPPGTLGGSLPDLPELSWEDFEQGSELAPRDLSAS
jgi:hypothetical protein